MSYSSFVSKLGRAVRFADGYKLQVIKAIVDTDKDGLVDFDPGSYLNQVYNCLPLNAFDYTGRSTRTLTITGPVVAGETVTIGKEVFEFSTNGVTAAGRYPVDISVYAPKAQQALSFVGSVVDGQTVTIGDTVFEFDTNSVVAEGNVKVYLGTDLTYANAIAQLVVLLILVPTLLGAEIR